MDGNTILYLVSIILVMIAWFAGKILIAEYIKTLVKQNASVELEEYKAELKAITLDIKYNHQRMLTDFSLFTNKKHEYYMRLYKAILRAESGTKGLRGAGSLPAFTDYNAEDIEEYLINHRIPKGKIQHILQMWSAGETTTAIVEIRKYTRIKRYMDAEKYLNKARNLFWYAQLYLSEEVKKNVQGLIEAIQKLLINYNDDYRGMNLRAENEDLIQKINDLLPLIISSMNREVGIADYAKDSQR